MHIQELINYLVVAFWVIRASSASAATAAAGHSLTLQSWLSDPEAPLLSSQDLAELVPAPVNLEVPHAYDRFSVTSAIMRAFKNTPRITFERPQLITEQEVHELTNDKYKLGLVYFWSLGGVPRNFSKALTYFEQAASEGDADAMFMAGLGHATGFLSDEIDVNPAKATLYYTLGAEQDGLESQVAMGHRKKYGINTPVDLSSSLSYYSRAGDYMLEALEHYHTVDQWHYNRVNRRTFAFGAEMNTGLYGKHTYKKHIAHGIDADIMLGQSSAAWLFVSIGYRNEFENLNDAVETLTYRAHEEQDQSSMYALARLYALGIDTSGPNWPLAVEYARKCLNHQPELPVQVHMHMLQYDKIRSMCAEFLGERYLHGGEGVDQNIPQARKLYRYAQKQTENFAQCNSCASGLVLCDWVDQVRNGTVDVISTLARIETAFSKTHITTDYTLPILYTKLLIANETGVNNVAEFAQRPLVDFNSIRSQDGVVENSALSNRIVDILRKTIVDTFGNAPLASLLLTKFEHGERKLNRFIQGIKSAEELYSPSLFAHASYARGDLESAILGFMVCSELGIRSASLNLGDLLDVRHSTLGAAAGRKWPVLRHFSEWPLPAWVTNRREHALRYFAMSAAQGSVDALAKVVEYGRYYKMIPAKLNQWYLESLVASNFGMAQWMLGTLEHGKGHYHAAMDRFMRALVTPEAWLPVKFSQYITVLHLVAKDRPPIWTRIKEAYKYMATFDANLSPDYINPFSESALPRNINAMNETVGNINYEKKLRSPATEFLVSKLFIGVMIALLAVAAARMYTRRQVHGQVHEQGHGR